jgi:hypothetical protein
MHYSAAGRAVQVHQKTMAKNGTVYGGILRDLAQQRKIERVSYDTRRKHFPTGNQFVVQPVNNQLRPGKILG